MYFIQAPALTLNLSSFTKLITLDAGVWDNVDLAAIKTLSHPDTGVLRNFVAPDNLETISTNYQFGNSSSATIIKFDSFTARGLESITGVGVFRYAVIDTLNLPSLESITVTGNYGTFERAIINTLNLPSLTNIGYTDGITTTNSNYTFASLNTNGNPLSLPKLDSIIGDQTFFNLMSSTLTLRTNLKISKPSGTDNFYYCCNTFTGDTFLNLLYSTEDGTTSGTPMTGVNLKGTETSSGTPGQWKMNATGSKFLDKLKTITLRPAEEEMVIPDVFTVKGAQNSSGGTISILFKKSDASAGVEWDESSQTYTWKRPSA